ncbi:phosphomutase-like protein [Spathaspora passalidarum NRRL Y-27907]|uniref:Phosphomutase-like protein n=1 Tax=Spathaspora passalidarum (strain NRRL Y-27907 / 11-Y1) TaxID=619300 RepID=G3AIJ8_SPAPN|nr:phosphomutase-like protein [Spathaspora passalidarum NRRL Y-27907]EGW33713.1 phosphomutase-like protein [Spathaspora passalidarum NRRL Y-27907]
MVTAQVVFKLPRPLPEFNTTTDYFIQSDPKQPRQHPITNFGLKDQWTWDSLIEQIKLLPSHKLFLLQRHGEGYHNIAPANYSKHEWNCYWQLRSGNGEVEWEDARLTPTGQAQITSLQKQITNTENFPRPHAFYVSPLRRTLETWELTWYDQGEVATIKELARETYGIGTESKRHSKTYIETHYPGFAFELGFTESDELWNPDFHESEQHRNYRAAKLLQEIFNENQENNVISLVAHSGLIKSILQVIGHRKWPMYTGELIPVVIAMTYDSKTYSLDDPWRSLKDVCKV